MPRVDCLVIGGGPSGLAFSYGLQGDTLVLEKEDSVGGLCRSIHHEGGVFDIGGHSFHTPHPEVFELINKVMDGGLCVQQRDAQIYTHGVLIPYPFQKYFDRIPVPDVVEACERGLRNIHCGSTSPANLEEFIIQRFGKGISEHFMLPYNRKLWARDIKDISCEWTSERVAGPKGVNERFEVEGDKRKPLQSDSLVGYPRLGGFEEIYKSFVPYLPGIEVNSAVARIDPKARIAITEHGDRHFWKRLVSTIPLPELTRIVDGTPKEIIEAANRLEYMSLRVELMLTKRQLDTPIQRIYVANPEIPPHKIALNHNSSDYLRQQPRHAITAEVSVSRHKPVDVSQTAPITAALLIELGILDSTADIEWQSHIDVKYAYPVYTHERPALVKSIKRWMAKHDIYTIGRFGDWEYINSDKCVYKALKLARQMGQG